MELSHGLTGDIVLKRTCLTSHDTFMTSALNDIGTLAQNHMWSFLEHAVREWQLTTVIPGDLVAQMEHGRPRCRALAAWRTTSQPNPMPSAGGSERDGERERDRREPGSSGSDSEGHRQSG